MAVNGLNYTIGNELKFTTNSIERGVVTSGGTWGFGTLSPNSIVHISGATDPLTITGLQGKAEANILTIDTNGVVGTRGDIFVSASIADNVITFTDSDGSTSSLASIDAITGLTIADNVIGYEGTGSFGADVTVDAVTSLGYNGSWGVSGDTTGNATASVALPFITAGSYDAGTGTITLDVNDASGVSDITITGLDGSDTFVTGGTFSSGDLTLELNDGTSAQTISGIWTNIPTSALAEPGFVLGSTTIELGDTVGTVAGLTSVTSDDFIGDLTGNADTASQWVASITLSLGTDLSGSVDFDGSGNVTLDATLVNSGVGAGSYGAADTVATFTVDADGRLTEASDVSIAIDSSAVTDFDTAVLSSVFEDANFVDSDEIDFTVSPGASVTAGIKNTSITNAMLAGSIANDKLVNSGFLTSGTTGGGSIDLGDSIIFTSTDGSVNISANNGTFDIEVDGSVDTHVTGGTYTQSTGKVELEFNQGFGPVELDGTIDFVDNATLISNEIVLERNVGADITVGTVNAVTGGSFDLGSGDITVAGSGTITDISLGTDFVTGVTEANNVISVTKNGGSASDLTIQALTGASIASNVITLEGSGLSDVVLDAVNAITDVTYNNDWDIALAGTGTISSSPVDLPFITGGTYSNGTLTLVTKDGLETIAPITGFEGDDTFLTGVTVGAGTGSVDFELNDAGEDFTATGFNVVLTSDSGSDVTLNLQGSMGVLGGTGIETSDDGSDITVKLSDIAGVSGDYGSASQTLEVSVNGQGQITSISAGTIDITASQVSDFSNAAETAIFTDANFVDSSDIEFVVTAGQSVSASLSATSVSDGSYGSSSQVGTFTVDTKGRLTAASNVTIDGSAINNNTLTFNGTDASTASAALNGDITFTSLDSSVVISGNGTTIDVQVSDAAITNIYTADGTLGGARTVNQGGNSLSFTNGGDFTVDSVFHYDAADGNVGIGTTTPNANAILELDSTTQGFLFPRMTETERGNLTEVQGLMVYQTDGDEGIYIYKSFGWVQVI